MLKTRRPKNAIFLLGIITITTISNENIHSALIDQPPGTIPERGTKLLKRKIEDRISIDENCSEISVQLTSITNQSGKSRKLLRIRKVLTDF
jgi:hypothetical protein